MASTNKKCYNSWSCILSVLVIVFMLGSVFYDLCISKPQIRQSINEIKEQIQHIDEILTNSPQYNRSLEKTIQLDTIYINNDTLYLMK